MRTKLIFYSILCFLMIFSLGWNKDSLTLSKKATAKSCCDSKAMATCTGSKSCTACKNCKYCKYCSKDGGSCGVCK